MRKLPRHLPIHYEDYAHNLAPEQRKAFYGLPKNVQFCRECVMSNQKPNSCYEFEHTIHSVKKTMVIQEDGVCDACHACHNKEGKIDWADRLADTLYGGHAVWRAPNLCRRAARQYYRGTVSPGEKRRGGPRHSAHVPGQLPGVKIEGNF